MWRFRKYGVWVFTPSALLLIMSHFLFLVHILYFVDYTTHRIIRRT